MNRDYKYAAPTELGRSRTTRGYTHVAPLELHGTRKRAFTVLELLILILTLFILVVLFLPMDGGSKAKAVRINCVNNLKQVGLAFRIWSADNNDRWPTSFYKNPSATLKFPDETNALRYFQLVTNKFSSPKIATCPGDDRIPAYDFSELSNTNLSYFIGLDGDETQPAFFLAGDRNLTSNGVPIPAGIFTIKSGAKLAWTIKTHQGLGNVGLCDGSVQQLTSAALTAMAAASSGTNVMRLLIP
jgi:prepilin-type processing-associated H-X9-DG protein